MKNRTLVTALRQFNPELSVSLKANLQYGCEEVGSGSGEYEGLQFTQDYTISWNEGYLSVDNGSYKVKDLINVLLEKTLSEISDTDFDLRPGELRNGNPDYTTTWVGDEPDEDAMPDDSELYNIMSIDDTEYKWDGANTIDIEVYYKDQYCDDATIPFVLFDDEVDEEPDPMIEVKKKKAVPKNK